MDILYLFFVTTYELKFIKYPCLRCNVRKTAWYIYYSNIPPKYVHVYLQCMIKQLGEMMR